MNDVRVVRKVLMLTNTDNGCGSLLTSFPPEVEDAALKSIAAWLHTVFPNMRTGVEHMAEDANGERLRYMIEVPEYTREQLDMPPLKGVV